MWKDREDTSDSVVFVKNTRQEHWGQKMRSAVIVDTDILIDLAHENKLKLSA